MQISLWKKGLIIGIIFLFIGINMSVTSKSFTNTKQECQNTHQTIENIFLEVNDVSKYVVKNWTWMFYDDADFTNAYDPLVDSAPGMPSFAEEAYSGENLNVIVLQDKEYDPACIWYIEENHTKKLIKEMGELNMGDYQTLYDFVEYSKTNYPADRYFISFYDHGGGWQGACIDDTSNDMLTMDEIQKSLTDAGGVDIICFTAPCLMGALESVYELRNCVDIYIGSEETSGYGHWLGTIKNISNILNDNPGISNIEIGQEIIDSINTKTLWPDIITMSAVTTDKMEEVANSIDVVAHDLFANYVESKDKLWSIYNDIQDFSLVGIIDAYDFAEKYSMVETNQSIIQHIENMMIYLQESVIAECHGPDYPDAHGLTIYFPAKKIKYNSQYNDPEYGLDFSNNTYWDEFLNTYMKTKNKSLISFNQL